jgi:hypothetical protein
MQFVTFGKRNLQYILQVCRINIIFFLRSNGANVCITLNCINQQDAANSQVYYLSFRYSSTCFGHPLLPLSSDDKPEAATAVVVASDDGHTDARNTLSCI